MSDIDDLLALAECLERQPNGVYVREGWWHPNVKSGQVHDHPTQPGRSWSAASHRLCEPVYTRRALDAAGADPGHDDD